MDRSERFYRIDQLLHEHKVVPMQKFLDELEISTATFKRDLDYMKDRFHAPIEWDREARGYRFVEAHKGAPSYALPGLWFNASEIHALLTMQHLLANIQPGLLGAQIEPLKARLRATLGAGDHSAEEIESRFHMLYASRRQVLPKHFQSIASALLKRKRLVISHFSRQSGESSQREISPQLLIYNRENWYVQAWCHLRNDLRAFAIDAITDATHGTTPAREVAKKLLRESIEAGYGIFGGSKVAWATLKFSAERARWVAAEQWHEAQRGKYDAQGHYLLEIPYSDDRELIMDILKHGAEVEVVAPAALRKRVKAELGKMMACYAGD
jgi:predicted DNA-binding transcriptional regulator YafY